MKILVVSGFLGAGKTTFIQELIKQSHKNITILENEVAGANIDATRLNDEDINIWELTEGCVCCSRKSDFATSVLTIANSLDPEYLIVEPTGVAYLSAVLNNIKKVEYERIKLLDPVCVVDAISYGIEMQKYPDMLKDQIKNTKTLVLAKGENLSVDEKLAFENELKKYNPDASLIDYHEASEQWFLSLLDNDFDIKIQESENTTNDFEELSLQATLEYEDDFILFMEDLLWGKYGEITRAKGQVKAGGNYLRFDLVEGNYGIIEADNQDNTAVFIGRNLEKEKIKARLIPDYVAKESVIRLLTKKGRK